MKHRLYTFNPETVTYEPLRVRSSQILAQVGISVVLGLTVAVLAIGYFLSTGRHPEDRVMALRNELHTAHLAQLQQRLERVDVALTRLHRTDNTFYRSILGLDKVDPALWEGGVGGTDRYSRLSPSVLSATAIRADRLRYQVELQETSFAKLEAVAKSKNEELSHLPAVRPATGVLVGRYGYRQDPFHGHEQFHPGLDIDANIGDPIMATGAGTVVIAGDQSGWGYGIQIEIDHGFGYRTKYAHLSRTAVKVGQRVKRGEVIGYAGNTGYSKGPHLHYEVIRHGDKVNPIDYFIDSK